MKNGLLTTQETLEYLDIKKATLDKRLKRGFIKPVQRIRNDHGTLVNLYAVEDAERLKGLIKFNRRNITKPAPPPEGFMTIAEVSDYFGLTQPTVMRYVKLGRLKSLGRLETSRNRPTIFDKEEVERFRQSKILKPVLGKSNQLRMSHPPKIIRDKQDEYHSTGCIIHWTEFFRDEKGTGWIPVTCARCKRKYNKREAGMRQAIIRGEFTGCCPDCYSDKRRLPAMKSNGRITREGYIYRHKRTFTEEEWDIVGQMNPGGGVYVPEHRALMALELGRPLTNREVVHHIDGDKQRNEKENLEIFDYSTHRLTHQDQLRRELELTSRCKALEEKVKKLEELLTQNGIKIGEEI